MPKNRHALVLQQNRERRDAEVRRHSHTYLLDMVTLALGRMGWGEKRLREFDAKLTEVSQEFAELTIDYTKAVLDRELQRYTGTMFVPYDERYRG